MKGKIKQSPLSTILTVILIITMFNYSEIDVKILDINIEIAGFGKYREVLEVNNSILVIIHNKT